MGSKKAASAPAPGPRAKRPRDLVPGKGVEAPLCPKCKKKRMHRYNKAASGNQRWACITRVNNVKQTCYITTDPSAPYRDQAGRARKADDNPVFKRKPGSDIVLITWAQNATPIHKGLMGSFQCYMRENDADLMVQAGRYKNPTSKWTRSQQNAEVWAAEVQEYLVNRRTRINSNLVLLGDMKVQPTRVRPLTGKEGMSHGESCILGHPKLQLKSVPTPQNKMPKLMTTTGAITVKNYTDSDAGKQGEFHHVLGATVVHIENNKIFHLRNIKARSDGAFIDFSREGELRAYYPDGHSEPAPDSEGIAFGDLHHRFMDKKVIKGTFGDGGLVERVRPKKFVFHDLLDAYSVSPHHEHQPLVRIAKARAGFNDARQEVEDTINWLRDTVGDRETYIVSSNHDNMLSRWISREDWKLDPVNAEFYLRTALVMVESARMGEGGAQYIDPFAYWVNEMCGDRPNIRALRTGESLTIAGIEHGMHGHEGPNGARGSVLNLSRLGVKVVSGHGHTEAIEEGHTRVGTSSVMNMEYATGPGSWTHSHCFIDGFGKEHLIRFINGRFLPRRATC